VQVKGPAFDKAKPNIPTAFLWQMLNSERMVTAPRGDLINVAATLIHHVYPGIEYWPSQTDMILNDLARPALQEKFGNTLAGFKTESEALATYGNRINVDVLRPCEGNEWETWHAEKRAMTEAKETARQYAALARQWDL
jgi:hypothetical protein